MLPDLLPTTPATAAAGLVAEGRRQGVPWCVWCNSAAPGPAVHRSCMRALGRTWWSVCTACHGGGIDAIAGSCFVCHGVGFTADSDLTAAEHARVLGLVDGVTW